MQFFLYPIWYIFLFFIIILLQKFTKCFTQINIFTTLIFAFLFRHGLFIPLNADVNDIVGDMILPDHVKIRWICSVILMYIFFVVGVIVAQDVLKFKDKSNLNLKAEILDAYQQDKGRINLGFTLLAISLSIFSLIALWQPRLIIEGFTGGLQTAADYKSARISYGEEFSTQGNIVLRIAATIKLGILPLFTYVYFFLQKQDKKYVPIFALILTVNLLLGLMSGQKFGMIYTAIGLVIAQVFSTGNTRISLFGKTTFFIVMFALLMYFVIIPFQYSIQYPDMTYVDRLMLIIYRISGETVRVLQLHFYIYPDIFPHLYGLSSSFISGLLGLNNILDPARVVRAYTVYGNTTDATGSWNAAFIGTAWADFGYIGVAIQSMIVTALLWYYHRWFIQNPKTPLVMGTYVTLMMNCISISEGNLLTALLTSGLLASFWVAKLGLNKNQFNLLTR